LGPIKFVAEPRASDTSPLMGPPALLRALHSEYINYPAAKGACRNHRELAVRVPSAGIHLTYFLSHHHATFIGWRAARSRRASELWLAQPEGM